MTLRLIGQAYVTATLSLLPTRCGNTRHVDWSCSHLYPARAYGGVTTLRLIGLAYVTAVPSRLFTRCGTLWYPSCGLELQTLGLAGLCHGRSLSVVHTLRLYPSCGLELQTLSLRALSQLARPCLVGFTEFCPYDLSLAPAAFVVERLPSVLAV
jgi:hypothetical protein